MPQVAARSQVMPTTRADTAEVPQEDRYKAWRQIDKVVSEIRPAAWGHRDPEAKAVQWCLDDLTVAKKACGPHPSDRSSDRRPRREHVRLRLYEKGRLNGPFGGTPAALKAGDIHFADMSVDFEASAEHMQHVTFLIPYAAVGYDPQCHPAQLRISSTSAQGRILETAMRCLSEQLPSASPDEARTLAQGLTGLVRGLLLSSRAEGAARARMEVSQRTAMQRYIDENLGNLSIGVQHLCEVFHASRATVYRHFGEVGGVSRYVKERRLDRAFNELAVLPAERGRIRKVAERWGFFEAGHFNRAFRQRFGMSPSEVAALSNLTDNPAGLNAACAMALSGTTA